MYLQPVQKLVWLVYITAFFLGAGATVILVGAVSMEADLVGEHVATGAFVYGFISFLDKLANGLVIKFTSPFSQVAGDVLKLETFVPAIATLLSSMMVFTIREYWEKNPSNQQYDLLHLKPVSKVDDEICKTIGFLNSM
jgi:hypothetical protein